MFPIYSAIDGFKGMFLLEGMEGWVAGRVSSHTVSYAHLDVYKRQPFMATENILMDAVKRGGDRQALHERIRVHSMEAGRIVKEEGGENDLIKRIASDPMFGVTEEELGDILRPEKYVGRAPEQTQEFVDEFVLPKLSEIEVSESDASEISI